MLRVQWNRDLMVSKRLVEFVWKTLLVLSVLAFLLLFFMSFRFGPAEGPVASIIKFLGVLLGPVV